MNGRNVYYIAILGNLGMRCAWALSISPGIMQHETLIFICGLIELIRRAVRSHPLKFT